MKPEINYCGNCTEYPGDGEPMTRECVKQIWKCERPDILSFTQTEGAVPACPLFQRKSMTNPAVESFKVGLDALHMRSTR
jgi:hypothetical protein